MRNDWAERIAAQEKAHKDAVNLQRRAKRRGVKPSVQAQREWVKANPCGFEIEGKDNG